MQREKSIKRPHRSRAAVAVLAGFIAAALSAGSAAARVSLSPRHTSAPPSVTPDLVIAAPHPEALRFGASVAAHGGTLAIASPTDGDLGNQPGRVDVLTITLDEQGRPRAAPLELLVGEGGGDRFGSSLALESHPDSGQPLLLVGAEGASLDPSGPGGFEGAVHLYEARLEPPGFIHRTTVVAAEPQPGSAFGHAVAWHPDAGSFAIGAPRHDRRALADAGSVTVYARSSRTDNSRWSLAQEIHASLPQMSEWFGAAVAMGISETGDWLAVGAPGRDLSTDLRGAGAVLLFQRSASGDYTLARTLSSPQPRRFAWFGASLALEGGRLVVGEPRGSTGASEPAVRPGAAWIFELDSSDASPIGLSPWPAQDGSGFGQSVAASSDAVVIGAPGFDRWMPSSAKPIEDIGCAFVFDSAGEPIRALQTAARHPSALFAPTATILDLGRARLAALGHLYSEEESPAPSAGVAIFAINTHGQAVCGDAAAPVPIPRTTWPGSAASRRHARSR